jgi:hypothetical protein
MKPMTEIEEVFAAFGKAAYHCQIMEYDLVSIWMLDSITQGVSLTRQNLLRFQGGWGKKTFGKLLTPLQKSNRITAEIKGFLEDLRLTRNRLMHHFFLDNGADLQANDGRQRTFAEIRRMTQLFEKGEQFFADVLHAYLKDFGVDAEAIRRQVLQNNEDALTLAHKTSP